MRLGSSPLFRFFIGMIDISLLLMTYVYIVHRSHAHRSRDAVPLPSPPPIAVIMIETSVGRGALWSALLQTGNSHHASVFLSLDIRGPNDLVARSSEVLSKGVQKTELESILAFLTPQTPVVVSGRQDHPTLVQHGGKASLTLALAAAQPNQRKRALEDLDRDVLARSTKPANDSRLKTFMALCGAWEVQAFPLNPVCIRSVGASFKAGCYRSAGIYFQTAISHQLRVMGLPVSPYIRSLIKDVVRSVRRGLGPATLKFGFDLAVLAKMVDATDSRPFSFDHIPHVVDLMIISCWFMLREIEVSAARDSHLTIQGEVVQLMVPVHKTNTMGSLTTRVLQCACGVREHPLCPWHTAERHLIRLSSHSSRRPGGYLPLFPQSSGASITKHLLVQAVRRVLSSGGIETTLKDDSGREIDKFGGHCLRVAGAQFLAAAGVQLPLIQLLGRWSSSAVERYVQNAPLSIVPQIPTEILRAQEDESAPLSSSFRSAVGPAPSTPAPPTQRDWPDVQPFNRAGHGFISDPAESQQHQAQLVAQKGMIDHLQEAVRNIQKALCPPDEILVLRPRSSVVHRSRCDESQNPPVSWRTVCGWRYGCTRFFRVATLGDTHRFCKKCFDRHETPEQGVSDDSDDNSSSSDSGSSSSDPSS